MSFVAVAWLAIDLAPQAKQSAATLGGSGLTTVVLGAVACILLLARRGNQ